MSCFAKNAGCGIESLESRNLMSAAPVPSAVLVGPVLMISGTDESDTIVVGRGADKKSVVVQMANKNGMVTKTFPKAFVWAAVVDGRAGDDTLQVSEAFGTFVPTLMVGGQGADVMGGGSADDVLVGDDLFPARGTAAGGDDIMTGGDGDDVMLGGEGNDVMLGGTGADYLDGGTGSNVLIGDDGRNRIKARSETDVVICNVTDIVDAAAGATVIT